MKAVDTVNFSDYVVFERKIHVCSKVQMTPVHFLISNSTSQCREKSKTMSQKAPWIPESLSHNEKIFGPIILENGTTLSFWVSTVLNFNNLLLWKAESMKRILKVIIIIKSYLDP